jgi:hypothetical protein
MVQSKLTAALRKEAPIKTLLKVFGAIVLLIAGVLGYAAYANDSAEHAARKFCAALQVGSDIDRAIARARAEGARYRGPRTEEAREFHDFEFQGWVFNVGVCRVTVAGGKIRSFEARLEGD